MIAINRRTPFKRIKAAIEMYFLIHLEHEECPWSQIVYLKTLIYTEVCSATDKTLLRAVLHREGVHPFVMIVERKRGFENILIT